MIGKVATAFAFLLIASAPAVAGEVLEPGAYKIVSRLELPHVEDVDVSRTETHCLVADGGTGKHGFAVQSENNPLRQCAMINVHETGDELTFDIKCSGSNLSKATARYLLMGTSFRGRIAMTMGGKNMTMTEVQEGHRVGACAPPS